MKRCPTCSRVYSDATLNYCLEDGAGLFNDSLNHADPPTAVLPPAAVFEAPTRNLVSDPTPIGHTEPIGSKRRLYQQKTWRIAVLLLVLFLPAAFFTYRYLDTSESTHISSIAVLPFENASGNSDLDYLSDGVSEGVIDRLSKLPQMKVIARTSSFQYRGQNLNLKEIAGILGVQAIITGRIVPRGDNYLIRVDVTNASDNSQLWGESFNRKATDIQDLQTDISREIAENLRPHLYGKQVPQQLGEQIAANPQAYGLLLQGRFYRNKTGLENVRKAIGFYEQAVALDPDYALACAELSEVYRDNIDGPQPMGTDERQRKREELARRALDRDPGLAQAHLALATIKHDAWEWQEAESEYLKAIELSPNLARAHSIYASYLSLMRRHDDAISEAVLARDLDPLSASIHARAGNAYFLARQYDEALRDTQKAVELEQNSPFIHRLLGRIYLAKGMAREAVNEFEQVNRLRGESVRGNEILLAAALASAGDREKAEEILSRSRADGDSDNGPEGLAPIYIALGDHEKAIAELEKAFTKHEPTLPYIAVNPAFDSLRSDPRFADLVRRTGLAQ